MTAWSILTASSSIPSGTAWQHLNAQQGGGPVTLVIYDQIEAVMMADIEASIDQLELEAVIESADIAATVDHDIGSELE